MPLPDRSPETTTVGQPVPTTVDREQAARWLAALDELAAEQATAIRVEDASIPSWKDGARIGTTPPVQQPGIPPMTNQAMQAARVFMYCSWATVPPGLIAVAVMVASEHANPTVIGMICAAPAAIAVPILALARLVRRAGESAPAEIHQHYNGAVHQDSRQITTRNVGVIANTRNQSTR